MTMKTTVAKPDSRGPAATAQTALTEKNGSPSQPSEREYYCLQRFDRCDLTPEKLLFAASIKAGRMAVGDPVLLGNGDWIGGGDGSKLLIFGTASLHIRHPPDLPHG